MCKIITAIMGIIMTINLTAGEIPAIDQALALIKQYEGFRPNAYTCPGGVRTIGYGTTDKALVAKGTITQEEAEQALLKEIIAINNYIVSTTDAKLNPNQMGALISFVYNVGRGNYAESTLKKRLEEGNFADVPYQLSRWNKSKGKILTGLVRRRAAEAEVWKTPIA